MDKRWELFLQNLVQEAHKATLPAALESKMIADLSIQLHEQIHTLVFSLLPNEIDRLQYQNMIMGEMVSPTDIEVFLQPRIPNLAEQLEQLLTQFRQDYLRICQTGN